MATETLAPDAVLDSTNYTTLNLTDIDEDPGSPDGAWGDWDGNGNTICRVSMPTPTGNPTVGADLQTFRVLIRKDAAGGASTTWSLQLWENGAQLAVLGTGTTTSTAGEVVSGTWNASLLGTADGSLVEIRLEQTGGGTGGGRHGIEVGAAAWDVTYTVSHAPLTAETGSFALSGQAAGLLASRRLTAGPGSFAITGKDATLSKVYVFAAEAASFGLTGNAASLRASRLLTAVQGAFALSGQTAGLTAARKLVADVAGFTLTGNAARLTKSRLLTAAQAAFTMAGNDAGLIASRLLTASAGNFALTGNAADLDYSGGPPATPSDFNYAVYRRRRRF